MPAVTAEAPDLPELCASSSPFQSILFASDAAREDIDGQIEPEFFPDLNLDKIVGAITKGREEYRLSDMIAIFMAAPGPPTHECRLRI